MSQITITITIDVPAGASVSVGGAPQQLPTPLPVAAPVAYVAAQGVQEVWPAGECPKHHKPWKDGNYGPYCTARDEGTPKGYCILKPGDTFQGKVAA